ncbi:hypothetical protein EHQ81_13530 [Leptospira selangorensis]|uniref:Uncharacterized protein n=1 Tax=Leptospira selangorensis TaxID=2484982 RepID=A0A5F2C1D4_9LEPT|nr:hypothetical protein [Leptospira selangorensis]TGM12555.1 hypothetical protein EHQ81_13530 [Leptospira selangorensis]TGM20179.1 hypothetical protein EHQ82_10895 [Leptospira selangorensis]
METFLNLTGIQWNALSSISTFLAVAVAIFGPIVGKYFKVRNILKVVNAEIDENLNLFKKAYALPIQSPGNPDYRLLKAAMLRSVKFDAWDQYKILIGENNPTKYSAFLKLNVVLLEIQEYSNNISKDLNASPFLVIYLDLLEHFYINYIKNRNEQT